MSVFLGKIKVYDTYFYLSRYDTHIFSSFSAKRTMISEEALDALILFNKGNATPVRG